MEKTSDPNLKSYDNATSQLEYAPVVAVLDPVFARKSKLKFLAVFDAWCNAQSIGVRAVPLVRPTRWKRIRSWYSARQ